MNSTRFLFAILVILFFHNGASAQLPVILDTDMDSDVDDVGALAMLHTLQDHEVVNLLGVIVTSDDRYAPLCADAINHYLKRPDIPIGVEKEIALREFSKYTRQISDEFPRRLESYNNAEDATALYRRLLASQPDTSVVIISAGHLTNLRHLLQSKPDRYSPLQGIDLVRKKVKLWSCMGGTFPQGKEPNFYRPDPESTQVCVEKWPGPVVFAGSEIGNKIMTGGDYLRRALPSDSPVRRAYQRYNNFQGRQSWDQAAVLYSVSSSDDYWDVRKDGRCIVQKDGSNQWITGQESNHGYLVEKTNPAEIAKVIDALMVGVYRSGF